MYNYDLSFLAVAHFAETLHVAQSQPKNRSIYVGRISREQILPSGTRLHNYGKSMNITIL